MAYVEPNGNITLYKCPAPITPRYNDTLWFSNIAAQEFYFNSLEKITYTNQMYTRTGRNKVRVEGYAEHLKYYNYMSFSNDPHSTQENIFRRKRFYAFVLSAEYINENVTEITFMIDELQSWLFDVVFNDCFIERQHSVSDNWGGNIEPEPLSPREYVSCNTLCSVSSDDVAYIMQIGTYNFNSRNSQNLFSQSIFSGLASTVKYIYFDNIPETVGEGDVLVNAGQKLVRFLNNCNFVEGAISGLLNANDMWDILALYAVPTNIFNVNTVSTGAINVINTILPTMPTLKALTPEIKENWFTLINDTTETSIPYPTRLGTNDTPYVPKNQKLLTFPYTYLSVETPTSSQDYKYELFGLQDEYDQSHDQSVIAKSGIAFKWRSMCNPQPSIIIHPLFYKNDRNPYHYALTITDFPQLPIYSGSLGGALGKGVGGALKMGLGLIFGAGAGALANATAVPPLEPFIPSKLDGKTERPKEERSEGLDAISNMGYAVAARIPTINTHGSITGGAGCTELGLTLAPYGDQTNVTFRMSIHQYGLLATTARRFDMFLSKYGYAQNTVAKPNLHARQKWTYIKTNGCRVSGYCPQTSIEAINKIMDAGITFWADIANAGKYTDVNGDLLDNLPLT